MPTARPRVLSGIQPTADSFHLGNYLGAVRQWVALQDSHDAFYCVVDLHGLTREPDPAELRNRTRVAAAQLLALGLDPDRCTLFVQSHVPAHSQLAWILGCLTGFGEAGRMTQFKDKAGEHGGATVGLFTYPVLMAADVLLYQAHQVPVGADQRQHLELTRDVAQRFNRRYGETFTIPEPYIVPGVAKILDLADPAAKMSKSAANQAGLVELLDDPDDLRRKVMRAVTDTGTQIRADAEHQPGITNLLDIFAAVSGQPVAALEQRYAGSGYGAFKKDLAELLVESFTPVRRRVGELLADEAELDRLLAVGAAKAGEVASRTLTAVHDRVGLLPVRGE